MNPAALEVSGVSKRYGSVLACDAVDLTVNGGEIHGLLGENGAGKSTLMKILLGLVHRDAGTISLRGVPTEISDPQAAAKLGLGMVHQHFSLIEPLTVWENVILGDTGRIDRRAACADVERVAAEYGLPIDPRARVADLSPGLRQRVELVKCLRRNPSVLVLDEPTSVLTQAESAELFGVLRAVTTTQNRAVVLISHKLGEIMAATDQVTVLRRGRVRFHGATASTGPAELAREMVGRDVSLLAEGAALGMLTGSSSTVGATTDRTPALRLTGLRADPALGPLDLRVAPGEIVGVYGVEGNGQTELGRVLAGLLRPRAGTVEIDGKPLGKGAPLGVIPEDRHHCGVVLDLSVTDNLLMKTLDGFSGRTGLLDRPAMRRRAQQLIDDFGIRTPSPDTLVRTLSGGNQQRVVLARELSARPKVLVAAQPTHGLDVGAIEEMYERLRAVAAQGVAVLLISTELEEVMALASRIVVMSRGRITGELTTAEATTERLGLLVGGMAA
ncbi:ABC transporter ATP-binding protein [Kineosporia sp. NBRC 101731]|uniref:ABC transporter ATP-binding protein n=1 Tax=Kineosporia sp. NBRC 101731 TaxID=3032199 RepID=UPI0024A20F8F|nr:ABC transporter ATP-binding protein [Kineosporia sp. NBRC 101731]GLY31627.1 ABC transporter ATP-binding protein [Kineosporia sp. NBRC 101731]